MNLLDTLFKDRRFHVSLITMLSIFILFSSLHRGGLSGYDDAIYAHEGKQMLLTGDWWNIRFNSFLNFEYPPMFIWLEALSMRVFGISDFAAKFPSALLGLGTILLIFQIADNLTDEFWLPILSMWVMLFSQYFMKYAMHAMTDVTVTFFFTLAIFLYVKGIKQPEYLILCGIAIGLDILTRSVIGLIPLGIIMLHSILIGQFRLLWSWHFLILLLLAISLPLIWYLSQYELHGSEFLLKHFAFIKGKVSTGEQQHTWRRVYGFLEYPWLLLINFYFWLPLVAVGLVMRVKSMVRCRQTLATLLVVWVVCVMIPHSLIEARVVRYILPVFPAFSMLAATPLNEWISKVPKNIHLKAIYLFLIIVVLGAGVVANPRPRGEDMRVLAPVTEAHTKPQERVILYTGGELHHDVENQLIWYANRFSIHFADLNTVKAKLLSGEAGVAIVDKESFVQASNILGVPLQVLGESKNFICFTLSTHK